MQQSTWIPSWLDTIYCVTKQQSVVHSIRNLFVKQLGKSNKQSIILSKKEQSQLENNYIVKIEILNTNSHSWWTLSYGVPSLSKG